MNCDFCPNQVVFIKTIENGQISKRVPAKIVCRCFYGTYKVRAYGSKSTDYVSEYQIEKYCQETAKRVKQQSGPKNKKMHKFLKNAEKDFQKGEDNCEQQKFYLNPQCKQEEGDADLDDKRDINEQKPSYEQKVNLQKHEVIENLKISNLISDYRISGKTRFIYRQNNNEVTCEQKSKQLLMMKLQWGFDDLIFHFHPETQKQINLEGVQNLVHEIMESEIIEPVEYVTCSILKKMKETISLIKKNKRPKLKNYLIQREEMIKKGFENYLKNYTLFSRVWQKFRKECQQEEKTLLIK